MFLLTALKIYYILDPNLSRVQEKKDNENVKLEEMTRKHQEDQLFWKHFESPDQLYNLYSSTQPPTIIWY